MWWYVQGDQCVFNWDSIVWEYDRWEGVEGISKEQTYIYLIPWHFALWEYKGTDNRQDRVQVQVFPPLFLYSGRACIWLATHSPKLLISEIESKMFHNKKVQSSIILSVRGQFIFIAVILSQERTIDSVFDHSLCEAILSMKNSNRAVFLFFLPSGWRNRVQSRWSPMSKVVSGSFLKWEHLNGGIKLRRWSLPSLSSSREDVCYSSQNLCNKQTKANC